MRFKYKTLRCILTPEYDLRKYGVKKLNSALRHLGFMRWNGMGFGDPANKDAIALIEHVIRLEGNFYIKHNYFPLWRQHLERRIRGIELYFIVLWAAIRGSDEIGFLD